MSCRVQSRRKRTSSNKRKSLLKRDGPKAPTAIHGPSGLKVDPFEKTNEVADCLENQYTHHGLCDENHGGRVKARDQDLIKAVDNSPHKKIRPCDLQAAVVV